MYEDRARRADLLSSRAYSAATGGEAPETAVAELTRLGDEDWPAFTMARLRLASQLSHPVLRPAAAAAVELLGRAADHVWATRYPVRTAVVAAAG